MEEEMIIVQNENNVIEIEENNDNSIKYEETVETIDVAGVEPVIIDSQEAFPALGADNADLNHSRLYGRDAADQHPITAITGLRQELDNIESLQTIYSDKKQHANYYMWQDENASGENREGFFVAVYPGTDKIQKCNSNTDVFGVTVAQAGFVGGQEYIKASDGTKTGRDSKYSLVVTSGITDVRCESDVAVGNYVMPNRDGIAEKSDGNYGYLVTAIADKNGVDYATISLAASSTLTKSLANSIHGLDVRMDNAEHNITAVGNTANTAYRLAQQTKDATQIDIGIIEEKINEALNRVDENTNIIENANNIANNASTVATQAKTIAQSAVNSAAMIRNEAVSKATEALENVNNLISDIEPIASWTDPNSGNSGASYFVEHIQNDLATKTEVETAETNSQHALAATSKNAESIQSLIAGIDKYSIGEYSQSYGLTFEQAQSILKADIVYIPTVDHNESTSIPINGNGIDDISTEEFLKGYAYTWDGTGWYVSSAQSVAFSGEYIAGSTACPYWVVVNQDIVLEDGTTYDLGGLYKWENDAWTKVASVIDNSISRAVSSIRQTANEISAEVIDARGDAASLNLRIQNNETTVQTLAAHIIGEYVTIETWNPSGKDATRIYYAEDTKLYWYSKDGAWNSTEKSYEAGLTGTMATIEQKADQDGASIAQVIEAVGSNGEVTVSSIVQKINDSESSVSINADKITMTGTTTFLKPEDVGENGTTVIDGGRIATNSITATQIDVDTLSAISANLGEVTAGVLKSKNYDGDNIVWNCGLEFILENDNTYVVTGIGTCTDTKIIIPLLYNNKTVSCIGNSAFLNCSNLTNVTISNGIISIEPGAFSGCSGLTSISIPDSVIYLNDSAFEGCSSLTSMRIPVGVTRLPVAVFADCSSLTSITIPNGVTSIRSAAFYGCRSLKSLTIPDSVTSIEAQAFEGCTSLTSMTIPDGVISIESYMFSGCSSLTSVIIPNGVTSIGSYAFDGCTSLTKVFYKGTAEEWGNIVVGTRNDALTNATIYYYSESGLTTSGNTWNYEDTNSIGVKISLDDGTIDSKYFKLDKYGRLYLDCTYSDNNRLEINSEYIDFISPTDEDAIVNYTHIAPGELSFSNTTNWEYGEHGQYSMGGYYYYIGKINQHRMINVGIFDKNDSNNYYGLMTTNSSMYITTYNNGFAYDDSDLNIYIQSGLKTIIESASSTHIGSGSSTHIGSGGDTYINSDGSTYIQSGGIYIECNVADSNIYIDPGNGGHGELNGIWKSDRPIATLADSSVISNVHTLSSNSDYSTLFDCLTPYNFKYTNDTSIIHMGFIAQHLINVVDLNSSSFTTDFDVSKLGLLYNEGDDSNSCYSLRYEEIIALCVNEIQLLKKRVKALEA